MNGGGKGGVVKRGEMEKKKNLGKKKNLFRSGRGMTKRGPAGADIKSAGRADDEVQKKERSERRRNFKHDAVWKGVLPTE